MAITQPRPAADMDREVGTIVEAIKGVAEGMFAGFRRAFAESDLSYQMGKVLFQLNKLRQIKVSELADHTSCDVGNLSGTLDRLEEAGLVERVASDADRRMRLIQPTAKGRKVAAQIESQFRHTPIYRELSRMNPRERSTLSALLGRLNAAINRD